MRNSQVDEGVIREGADDHDRSAVLPGTESSAICALSPLLPRPLPEGQWLFHWQSRLGTGSVVRFNLGAVLREVLLLPDFHVIDHGGDAETAGRKSATGLQDGAAEAKRHENNGENFHREKVRSAAARWRCEGHLISKICIGRLRPPMP